METGKYVYFDNVFDSLLQYFISTSVNNSCASQHSRDYRKIPNGPSVDTVGILQVRYIENGARAYIKCNVVWIWDVHIET